MTDREKIEAIINDKLDEVQNKYNKLINELIKKLIIMIFQK